MYRCEVCRWVSKPGAPRLTHCLKRPNGQIERELAVCRKCHTDLALGCSIRDLLYVHQTSPVPFSR